MKKSVDSMALNLLDQMLIYDPSKRLSAKRALLHPYFDDLDKMALPAKPGEYQILPPEAFKKFAPKPPTAKK